VLKISRYQDGFRSPQVTLCFPMERETKRSIRELAYYGSLGLSIALSIFIGLGIGVYLDRRFDTTPWCTFIFLGLGIAAGYRNIALAIKKTRKY